MTVMGTFMDTKWQDGVSLITRTLGKRFAAELYYINRVVSMLTHLHLELVNFIQGHFHKRPSRPLVVLLLWYENLRGSFIRTLLHVQSYIGATNQQFRNSKLCTMRCTHFKAAYGIEISWYETKLYPDLSDNHDILLNHDSNFDT